MACRRSRKVLVSGDKAVLASSILDGRMGSGETLLTSSIKNRDDITFLVCVDEKKS